MKRLLLCTAALIGMAGVAQAQTMGTSMGASSMGSSVGPNYQQQAYGSDTMERGPCGHSVAITDEYGFKYDSMGDRLNGQGCVIAPPVTPPGARAIQR
ncbi:hypothetical protein SAMN02745126_01347 [Enhydrobacter aerosaccus]|uniref:Uncharacterized protein n=1 Tax=Enhydrobacter aerosaccus TaxID=225324 RepID=A0A1T4L4Q2_9HYPH|nr:hypothetical protein [Enhydrobacter aerosaccus]SJZ49699.1 hypothetical protein SAMN02745126_01347 [Enhydrobacter aerosaccus]